MTRYILSTIAVFGNLGHIISITILSQEQRGSNSCSIYLLATSISGLIIMNWAIILLVYVLDHIDLMNTSLTLCHIRVYMKHTSSMCFRYVVVVACTHQCGVYELYD
ncbi:unnamed protein product [Adineta steineri]|uniref:G-protein coupled receptors family 1 profile domain-containing protein n=1 Tax=Adineta steineri TaxID=433720 RepID=A0A813UAB0_9BILA|nr:unnamed protein product [Adineta steineri]CAF1017987.1 unnamed protein product [Adineta steineri]